MLTFVDKPRAHPPRPRPSRPAKFSHQRIPAVNHSASPVRPWSSIPPPYLPFLYPSLPTPRLQARAFTHSSRQKAVPRDGALGPSAKNIEGRDAKWKPLNSNRTREYEQVLTVLEQQSRLADRPHKAAIENIHAPKSTEYWQALRDAGKKRDKGRTYAWAGAKRSLRRTQKSLAWEDTHKQVYEDAGLLRQESPDEGKRSAQQGAPTDVLSCRAQETQWLSPIRAIEKKIAELQERISLERTFPHAEKSPRYTELKDTGVRNSMGPLTKRALWRQGNTDAARVKIVEAELVELETTLVAFQKGLYEYKAGSEPKVVKSNVDMGTKGLLRDKGEPYGKSAGDRLGKRSPNDDIDTRQRWTKDTNERSITKEKGDIFGGDPGYEFYDQRGPRTEEELSWEGTTRKTPEYMLPEERPVGGKAKLMGTRQPRFAAISQRNYSTRVQPPPRLGQEDVEVDTTVSSNESRATASTPTSPSLPHLTSSGTVHMVSVATKSHTLRSAIAVGTVYFSNPTPLSLIRSNSLKKGDVLSVSRIAGIMAAKKCPDIVPLCHPIMLTHVSVEVHAFDSTDDGFGGVAVEAKVQCEGQTGVEMEALTAITGSALSVVDMCKAVDKGMRIDGVRVVLKEGGRSGVWREEGWRSAGDKT